MPVRTAEAQWTGDLQTGSGSMKVGSGAFEGAYSFRSRMQDGDGTNPEELIGAAHAGCYSMALTATLAGAGFTPTRVHTNAKVHFEKLETGFTITKIELQSEAVVPNIDSATFIEKANYAKANCPVSKALAATEIVLDAKLVDA